MSTYQKEIVVTLTLVGRGECPDDHSPEWERMCYNIALSLMDAAQVYGSDAATVGERPEWLFWMCNPTVYSAAEYKKELEDQ